MAPKPVATKNLHFLVELNNRFDEACDRFYEERGEVLPVLHDDNFIGRIREKCSALHKNISKHPRGLDDVVVLFFNFSIKPTLENFRSLKQFFTNESNAKEFPEITFLLAELAGNIFTFFRRQANANEHTYRRLLFGRHDYCIKKPDVKIDNKEVEAESAEQQEQKQIDIRAKLNSIKEQIEKHTFKTGFNGHHGETIIVNGAPKKVPRGIQQCYQMLCMNILEENLMMATEQLQETIEHRLKRSNNRILRFFRGQSTDTRNFYKSILGQLKLIKGEFPEAKRLSP